MAHWSTDNDPAHDLRTSPGPDATVRVPCDESATSSLLCLRFCELLATKVYFVVSVLFNTNAVVFH
ncbi:hypothetical protein Plhal304r1_c092g0172121 [Plasmopara halstedii]